jgi:hypothetical protein
MSPVNTTITKTPSNLKLTLRAAFRSDSAVEGDEHARLAA